MSEQALPDFDTLWDYNDPEGTERAFRALLAEARRSAGEDYVAQLLTQIARTEGLQGRFEEAHATLDTVAPLLSGAGARARIRYLLERGRAFNSSGATDDARAQFLGAWHLATEHGEDALAVDAAHMLGIVEPGAPGLEWNLAALELAQHSGDPKAQRWQGSLLNNIGWSYHDMGRYDDALKTFQQGLQWQQSAGRTAEARIAAWTVARALRSLGRTEEALALQRQNLEAIAGTRESDGFIQEELGECLLELGRTEEARPHFSAAYGALSKDRSLTRNEGARLERLRSLAET